MTINDLQKLNKTLPTSQKCIVVEEQMLSAGNTCYQNFLTSGSKSDLRLAIAAYRAMMQSMRDTVRYHTAPKVKTTKK